MTSRYIPRVVDFSSNTFGEDTLFYRYMLGDNILNKSIYNNLCIGKSLEQVAEAVDLAYWDGSFYLKIRYVDSTGLPTFYWQKLYLGPILVRFDSIYTKEEMDALLAALSFEGTLIEWNALTRQEKEAFLVGKVRPHE